MLYAYAGKRVGVVMFTATELHAVLNGNPFPDHAPKRTVAICLDERPTQ